MTEIGDQNEAIRLALWTALDRPPDIMAVVQFRVALEKRGLVVRPPDDQGVVKEIDRSMTVRHFWARTDPPPERLILWRGAVTREGRGWEVAYVRADELRGAVDLLREARTYVERCNLAEATDDSRRLLMQIADLTGGQHDR